MIAFKPGTVVDLPGLCRGVVVDRADVKRRIDDNDLPSDDAIRADYRDQTRYYKDSHVWICVIDTDLATLCPLILVDSQYLIKLPSGKLADVVANE